MVGISFGQHGPWLCLGWYGSWYWLVWVMALVLVGIDFGLVLVLVGMGLGLVLTLVGMGLGLVLVLVGLGFVFVVHWRKLLGPNFFPETLGSEKLLHSEREETAQVPPIIFFMQPVKGLVLFSLLKMLQAIKDSSLYRAINNSPVCLPCVRAVHPMTTNSTITFRTGFQSPQRLGCVCALPLPILPLYHSQMDQ